MAKAKGEYKNDLFFEGQKDVALSIKKYNRKIAHERLSGDCVGKRRFPSHLTEGKKMYYVLGKEMEGGKKNGAYHVYEITMERKRAAEAVESLMEFDKSTAPARKPSSMIYKVIETDGKEFFKDWFTTFDVFEKFKAEKEKGELRDGCVIDFNEKNDKSDIIDAVDNISKVSCLLEMISGILFLLKEDFNKERKKEFFEMLDSNIISAAQKLLTETVQLIDK